MAMTSERIIETAEAITERGESPTLAAVRRELGGGSYTTISEVMKEWKAKRQAALALAAVVQVPTAVQEAMSQAAITVWTAATQQHAATLAAERETLKEERQRLEGERREAVELADQVSRELEQRQAEADQLRTALDTERQSLSETRTALAKAEAQAEERLAHVETLSGELAQVRQVAQEQASEAAELRGQLTALESLADVKAEKPKPPRQRQAPVKKSGDE